MNNDVSSAIEALDPAMLEQALRSGLFPPLTMAYHGGAGDEGWSREASPLHVTIHLAQKRLSDLRLWHDSQTPEKSAACVKNVCSIIDILAPYDLKTTSGMAWSLVESYARLGHDPGTVYDENVVKMVAWANAQGIVWDKKPGMYSPDKGTRREQMEKNSPGLLGAARVPPKAPKPTIMERIHRFGM